MRTSMTLALIASVLAIAAFASHADTREPHAAWIEVASKLASGTRVDFTPHGTQPGLVHPILPPESQCSGCHAASTAAGDPASAIAFRPFSTWAGSMMANATRDPLFFAALDIANHDVPGVGDYCLRCHTPRGWLAGHVVKPDVGAPPNDVAQGAAACLLDGTYDRPDDAGSDFGGVTCHYCHRLLATGPGGEPAYTENANAFVDDTRCTADGPDAPCRRGPYDYADGESLPPHDWAYSAYHTDSAICGLCHNVSTPDTAQGPLRTLKLDDGTDTGHPFPVERTFAEWRHSRYAQAPATSCQSCHMPTSEDPDATACSFRLNNRSGDLPVHTFVGGNTWVPAIIKGEYGAGLDTSGTDRSAALDRTVEWAREMLGQAASIEATIASFAPPSGAADGTLALSVRVTNLSGHKLPTGYSEGRRAWLNIEVHDAAGALVFESAAYDATSAVLTRDAQARIYETRHGIWNHHGDGHCDADDASGDPMFHFVLDDCIASDTRIPPLGFEPASSEDPAGYDLRPVGATYPETSPGSGVLVNYDVAAYTIAIPAGTELPVTATARLYYQTASRDYMRFLRDEADSNGFPAENALCSGGPERPFLVGPKDRSRGRFAFDLWDAPSAQQRIFADGFDGEAAPVGYGKSPPELMQVASTTTRTSRAH